MEIITSNWKENFPKPKINYRKQGHIYSAQMRIHGNALVFDNKLVLALRKKIGNLSKHKYFFCEINQDARNFFAVVSEENKKYEAYFLDSSSENYQIINADLIKNIQRNLGISDPKTTSIVVSTSTEKVIQHNGIWLFPVQKSN